MVKDTILYNILPQKRSFKLEVKGHFQHSYELAIS